jgi:hypothetical protein
MTSCPCIGTGGSTEATMKILLILLIIVLVLCFLACVFEEDL